MINILILCTGNSCRSILAEALINQKGQGRVHAYSAGSHPTGKVNAHALACLVRNGLPATGYSSQSWDAFAQMGIDIAITVCDQAAGEVCPIFLNSVVKGHWGVPDPAHVTGSEEFCANAFQQTFNALAERVDNLLALPIETLSAEQLTQEINSIGERAQLRGGFDG
ncbi:MAG: arsenate reductase ArsC [Methylovulum sp.]|jgi:arsenate reductase|nr:arsenate reductase ArsC [Methylovulum sp.]